MIRRYALKPMAITVYVFWGVAGLTFAIATPIDKKYGLRLGVLICNWFVLPFTIFCVFMQVH